MARERLAWLAWAATLAALAALPFDLGDVDRYFAYSRAALGRPYARDLVRDASAWRASFAAGETPRDDGPEATPTRPLLPYRDFFVEYPPGFFAFALPPALLAPDRASYRVLFGAWMALLLSAALALGRRLLPDGRALVPWSAAALLALGLVAVQRYDAAVSLALVAAVWGAARGRPALAGLALGVAAASKGVPLVCAPALALHLRRPRAVALFAAATALALAAWSAPLLASDGAAAALVAYHRDRPLQIESPAAALLLLARSGARVAQSFGSTNLEGPLPALAGAFSTVAAALGLAAAWIAGAFRIARAEGELAARQALVDATVAALALPVALGKVASPQYLVWLLPLGLVASLLRRGSSRLILLAAMALSQLVYPLAYPALVAGRPWAAALSLGRALALGVWAVIVLAPPRAQAR
jgi:hypothetical protein